MISLANKEQQLVNLEKDFEKHRTASEKAQHDVENHWWEMGKILCKIRDGKLHPQHTFSQYCWQRWNIKRAYGLRLCRAFETVKQLEDSKKSTNSEIVDMPTTVTQADELAKVPKDKRLKVLKKAKSKGRVTAKSIKEAAKTMDVIEKDGEGYPIPSPAQSIWNRRDEVKSRIRPLQELLQWVTDMQGTSDPLYAEVNFSGLKLDVETVIRGLKRAVPYVVCAVCQGQAPKTCTLCKGRGMISKFLYRGIPVVPEEMKKMREQVAATA